MTVTAFIKSSEAGNALADHKKLLDDDLTQTQQLAEVLHVSQELSVEDCKQWEISTN